MLITKLIWLISKVIAQKCSSSANLQETSFELCLKMLHFQKQPFKQLLWKKFANKFSHTLDNLHTLDKFSFTFRSRCSQIILKIDRCLKNFAIFTGKHLRWSLFLIMLQAFRPATLLKKDSDRGVFLWILQNF